MNTKLDADVRQKILEAILADAEIRQLVLDGTVHFPVEQEPPTMPDELGYSPVIGKAHQKARQTAGSFVEDIDPLEFANLFLEARRRISG